MKRGWGVLSPGAPHPAGVNCPPPALPRGYLDPVTPPWAEASEPHRHSAAEP